MKTEIDIVFILLRAALTGEDVKMPTIKTHQWWSVFKLMQRNHVAALASVVVERWDIPREVKIPWLAEREKAIGWYRYQSEVQQDIINKMCSHGIETLVLKGTHTAQYYPQPELREFGDLDLFFKQHKAADDVARKEMGVTINNGSHHHTKYSYRGVTVESHRTFVNTHYPPSNRRYESMLEKMAPSATFEVLFLLRHLSSHFAASRITLRDLVDWHLTCLALRDKADWDKVQKAIKRYGITRFAAALCTLTEQHFDSNIPLDLEADMYTVKAVERDIVYGSTGTMDKGDDGIARLGWKLRRWNALGWKRRMVYKDSPLRLWLASLASHAEKPRSILHKQ